jgi:transposase-like protein
MLEARRIYLGNKEEYAKEFYTRACYTSYVITLYAVGVSTRKFFQVLGSIYGAYYSLQSVSRLILDIWV